MTRLLLWSQIQLGLIRIDLLFNFSGLFQIFRDRSLVVIYSFKVFNVVENFLNYQILWEVLINKDLSNQELIYLSLRTGRYNKQYTKGTISAGSDTFN